MQLLLPAGLPGYEITDPGLESVPSDKGFGACVIVALPELQLQFRLHDYYMGRFSSVEFQSSAENCPRNVTQY